jgi:uncharacterized protein
MPEGQRGFIAPAMDADSAIWWEGLQRKVLLLQRCSDCGRRRCPPLPSCPYCGGPDSSVVAAAGRGSIYSWTTVHRSLAPQFADDEPYTVLTVQLDEGPRLFARLLHGKPTAGAPVQASFYEVAGRTLVGFEVTRDGEDPEQP